MNNLSAQDILVAHIQVCHSTAKPAVLNSASTLKEIESQLSANLSWFTPLQAAAYVGMQIKKRRPFAYSNDATAVAMTLALVAVGGYKVKIKDPINKTDAALGNSSVVDDVADELLLICER